MKQIIEFAIMLIFDIIILMPIILIIKAINNKIKKLQKEKEEIEDRKRKKELDYLAKQIALEQHKMTFRNKGE